MFLGTRIVSVTDPLTRQCTSDHSASLSSAQNAHPVPPHLLYQRPRAQVTAGNMIST